MSNACFKRLGISPNSSEEEIKQAYRRLALATHPDKVAPEHREAATVQFREIHEAYTEALEQVSRRPSSSSSSYSCSSNTKRTSKSAPRPTKTKKRTPFTDSELRSAFQDVCDELDREYQARKDESRRQLVPLMETTWLCGGQEACRELCRGSGRRINLLQELEELSEYFAACEPNLSIFLKNEYVFLKNKSAERSRVRLQRFGEKIERYAQQVDEQWPAHAEQLKFWANDAWTILIYKYVAAKVKNPQAARAILEWKAERNTALDLKRAARLRVKAGQIVDAFPDVDA